MALLKRISGALCTAVLAATASGAFAIPLDFPFSDDVAGAGELQIGVIAGLDNVNATPEASEPNPGAGTGADSCNSQDGWCSGEPPSIQNSLWAWLTAPDGLVSIDFIGSYESEFGSDLQFALYSVGDVGDFATFTEVAANDDSSTSGAAFAPYIAPIALTPGARYYLQVDGFGGETVEYGQVLASAHRQEMPVPSVLALLGIGLISMGLVSRRKAR